jgi:8-oxo-dGTP diphosphatase
MPKGKTMSEKIEKAGWVHIVDKRILVTRNHDKDKYYLPGGKLDAGETNEQALIRELREELTISVIPETIHYLAEFKAQAEDQPQGVIDHMTCYTAGFTGEISLGAEIGEIAWFRYEDRGRMRAVEKVIFDWLKDQNWID